MFFVFFSSRRRHTRLQGDWSSDVCSSDLSRLRSPTALRTEVRAPSLLRSRGDPAKQNQGEGYCFSDGTPSNIPAIGTTSTPPLDQHCAIPGEEFPNNGEVHQKGALGIIARCNLH